MAEFLVGKHELEDLLLKQHLNIKQTAARVGVTEKTVRKYMKVFAIDARLWWKYQQIVCPECNVVIDPDCQLDEETRKRFLRKGYVLCEQCKLDARRKQDREHKQEVRDANRDVYNAYQKELMRKRRAETKKKQQEGE